jgi:hypothetical protein
VAGSYAYLGVGLRMVIVDVSAPDAAHQVGESDFFPGIVSNIKVVRDRAYVSLGSAALWIVNVADPANPQIVGSITLTGPTRKDVSDQTRPQLVGQVDLTEYGDLDAFFWHNGYLFTRGHNGVCIIDVNDPVNPREIAHFEDLYRISAVYGDYVYASSKDGLRILDLSDPADIQTAAAYQNRFYFHDAIVVNDYLIGVYENLEFYDVSDPLQPKWVASIPLFGGLSPDSLKEVAVLDDYIYVSTGSGGVLVYHLVES